jgi:tRNA threonylcarbamoyl adenosine modification protein YeaZ
VSTRLAVSGSNLTGDVPFSAALSTDAGISVVRSPAGERGDLTRLCQTLCEQQGLMPEQIEEVLVDVGPGSYTGLRVAVTFVRFLQSFGSIPVQAVDSLALLAHHCCGQHADGVRVRPLLDARRGRYHTARFEYRGGELVELEAANATNTDQVLASLEPGERVVMPAAFAEQLGEQLRERNVEVIVARDLGADALFASGLPLFSAKAEDLEPRYLMATYAED